MSQKKEKNILKTNYNFLSYVYVRYFFSILYTLIYLLFLPQFQTEEKIFYGGSIFLYFITSLIYNYLILKNKKYKYRDIFIILFDLTIIFGLYSIIASISALLAAITWKNVILFFAPIFIIVSMSFFDFSRKFLIFTNIYIIFWLLILVYFSYQSGVNFALEREETIKPEGVNITTPYFIMAFYTFLIFLVYRIKTLFKNYFFELEAREKETRENLAKLKWFFHDMNRISDVLNENVDYFKNFIEEFNKEMQEEGSSIEEISATMEELSSTSQKANEFIINQYKEIQEFENTNKKLLQSIQNLQNSLQNLKEEISKTEKDSAEVKNAMQGLNSIMEEIQNSFNEVLEATEVINEISDRTNLLSLNASIEAARAGEYGKGFAVVAQEINRLAETSQENAQNIDSIINASAASIKKGVENMEFTKNQIQIQLEQISKVIKFFNEFHKNISEQIELNQTLMTSLNKIFSLSKEIEQISKEQSISTNSVSQTITNMEKGILKLSNNANKILEYVNQIKKLAESLKSLDSKYESK